MKISLEIQQTPAHNRIRYAQIEGEIFALNNAIDMLKEASK